MIKKTKIVATIGPSSWKQDILKRMIDSGMNVARINASFADFQELKRVSSSIRKISQDIAIMIDLKGHKIRISELKRPKIIKTGQYISIYSKKAKNEIYFVTETDIGLEKQIPKGSVIFIDDGTIKLQVKDIKYDKFICKVIQGGQLTKSKNVNIPGIHIEFPQISKKDFEDIQTAKQLEFDFIAASFVRDAKDIICIKKLLQKTHIKIIAKIENSEGVSNFDSILNEADGIMIARGDLGVEIPVEKVPILQEKFIQKCNISGKPVIVATQMLQSMTENVSPTRAEVNDVADAISDGADALMLSAETSTGRYPVESVMTMSKIAKEIEKEIEPIDIEPSSLAKPITNAIAKSVIDSCKTLPIDKIIVATSSGTTAKTIARFRPKQPIFAFTKDVYSKRSLALSRGIIPDVLESVSSSRDIGIKILVREARDKGYVSDSDMVIVVAGANILGQGETNILEINRVEQIIN